MAPDFLQAWLVEGDVVAAMGYVSERSYACLAQDTPDPSAFDRGLAPFQIMVNLKAAQEALGKHDSLEGLTARCAPDDPWSSRGVPPSSSPVRSSTTCPTISRPGSTAQTRLMPARRESDRARTASILARPSASPGQPKNASIALLWAKEDGYWKIVSWQTEPEPDVTPAAPRRPSPRSCGSRPTSPSFNAAKTSWTPG